MSPRLRTCGGKIDHLPAILTPITDGLEAESACIYSPFGASKTTLAKFSCALLEKVALDFDWSYVQCTAGSSWAGVLHTLLRNVDLGKGLQCCGRPDGVADHFLHALSKDIVERCAEHDVGTLGVGDPSGVDDDDWGRHGNKRLDNWAYKRVMNLIDYKARERGMEVEMPNERGTSSACSVCWHEDDDSRVERGLWKCDRCGMVAHGDVNGADNIRQKTLPVTPPLGDSGNGCLAQPHVIQFSRTRGFQPRATAE